MRRVAEFSGVDAGEIEPDARLAEVQRQAPRPLAREDGERRRPAMPRRSPQSSVCRRAAPAATGRGKREAGRPKARLTPQALAAARLRRRAATNSTARATRPCAASTGSTPGSRARARAALSRFDTADHDLDPMQAELCGFSLAVDAERGLLRAAGHRQGGDGGNGGLFRGDVRPTRFPRARRARGAQAAAQDPGVLKIGQDLKFDLADFRAARHRDRALRRHHADVLRARRRPRRPRPGRARRSAISISARSTSTR